MKECNDCGEHKPLDEFNWRNKADGTKQPYCRPCQRERNRQDYQENKSRWEENNKRYKKEIRQYVFNILIDSSCIDCGEAEPEVLQFDHRDRAKKTITICEALQQGWSIARLDSEIEKCDIRCSNCHIKRTAKQLGWYEDLSR